VADRHPEQLAVVGFGYLNLPAIFIPGALTNVTVRWCPAIGATSVALHLPPLMAGRALAASQCATALRDSEREQRMRAASDSRYPPSWLRKSMTNQRNGLAVLYDAFVPGCPGDGSWNIPGMPHTAQPGWRPASESPIGPFLPGLGCNCCSWQLPYPSPAS